jgi:hypothetical protein
MIKNVGFEILLVSAPACEKLVAEIYYDGCFVALVNQERGSGSFELEMPGRDLDESKVLRSVDLAGFMEILKAACLRLTNK